MNLNVLLLINWGIGLNVLKTAFMETGRANLKVITGSVAESDDPFACGISQYCKENNIDIIAQSKESVEENISSSDLVISAACPYLIKEYFLSLPRYGVVNLHGSLLPKSRGVSPLHWSLIRAEKTVGLTTHFIDKGMDSGDILIQSEIPVLLGDNVHKLSDRISMKAPEHIKYIFNNLDSLSQIRRRQDLSLSTYAPRLKKTDMEIDFAKYDSVFDLVLGIRGRIYKNLLPHFSVNGKLIRILEADYSPSDIVMPDGDIYDLIENDLFFSFKNKIVRFKVKSEDLANLGHCENILNR